MRFSHILTGGLLVLCIATIHAQEDTTMPLLPSQLGPMESLMWSEHGAMRKIFDFPLTPEGREKEMRLKSLQQQNKQEWLQQMKDKQSRVLSEKQDVQFGNLFGN